MPPAAGRFIRRGACRSARCSGDACATNCDGSVNLFDIQPFINVLTGVVPAPCSPCAADTNANGTVNQFDIQSFLDCLMP